MLFVELNKEQQSNHVTLLDGMIETYGDSRRSKHFDMSDFQRDILSMDSLSITQHECDTSACLLGHAPIFGVVKGLNESWSSYSLRSFGHSVSVSSNSWDFLFFDAWPDDIQEAIARLKMYIEGFDPASEEWTYESRYAGGDA